MARQSCYHIDAVIVRTLWHLAEYWSCCCGTPVPLTLGQESIVTGRFSGIVVVDVELLYNISFGLQLGARFFFHFWRTQGTLDNGRRHSQCA